MNTRIAKTFTRAIRSKVYEGFLDCYNDTIITNGVCVTVTTRIYGCSHYWVLTYDED